MSNLPDKLDLVGKQIYFLCLLYIVYVIMFVNAM